MTPQPTETKFTAARLWAAAIKKYEIDWNGPNDRAFFCKVKYGPGPTADDLKSFFTEYNIQRTLPEEKRVDLYNEVKNKTSDVTNRGNLSHRAKCLFSLVVNDKNERNTKWDWKKKQGQTSKKKSTPKSAISKLSWFVDPNCWTMYDSYAVRAMERRNDRNGRIEKLNFNEFYKRLDDLNVGPLMSKLHDFLLESNSFNEDDVFGSRVVDKAFWIMGSHDYYKMVSEVAEEKYLALGHTIAGCEEATSLQSHLNERWGVPVQ